MSMPAPAARSSLALLLATASLGVATAAFAQSEPSPLEGTLEEVVVTARKREENLQSVPIAVTALSGGELAKQNVTQVSDVGLTVPGFATARTGGNPAGLGLVVRGQTSTDTTPGADTPVAIYVDGVLWARNVGANAAMTDVQSVEVLKGPQGTLFGRNTTGGALNIRTRDPEFGAISGYASATLAEYHELNAVGVLNLPLVADKLAARLVYAHNEHDGYDVNRVTGQRGNSVDNDLIRVKLLAEPSAESRVLVSYERFEVDQVAPGVQLSYFQPGGFLDAVARVKTGGNKILVDAVNAPPRTIYAGAPNTVEATTQTASVTASYDLGFAVLKAIGGYREVRAVTNMDLAGAPFTVFNILPQVDRDYERTAELQLNGEAVDGRLTYTAGLYAIDEAGRYRYDIYNGLPNGATIHAYVSALAKNKSEAAFFQGSFKITDRLTFTGGLRYSQDRKSMANTNGSISPSGGFACNLPNNMGGAVPANCSQTFKLKSDATDYLASLDYRITPDILVYAKVSHGYKAAGLNPRGGATPETFGTLLRPEIAVVYETGIKSELLERRLRVNAALYQTDYSNIQRTIVEQNGATTITIPLNAATATIKGVELEAQAVLAEGLRLGGSYGYVDAGYDTYTDARGSHVNEPFPFTPKHKFSLTVDYSHDAFGGLVNLHADYSWQSRIRITQGYVTNGGADPVNFPADTITQDGYGQLSLRASFLAPVSNVEFAIFGRNVLDKTAKASGASYVDNGLGFNTVTYNAPSVWGAQVTYRFGG